jgi:hypothetical protein
MHQDGGGPYERPVWLQCAGISCSLSALQGVKDSSCKTSPEAPLGPPMGSHPICAQLDQSRSRATQTARHAPSFAHSGAMSSPRKTDGLAQGGMRAQPDAMTGL